MKVEATRTGFYGEQLRHEGDVFAINGKHELGSWMKQIRKKPGPKKREEVIEEVTEEQDVPRETLTE